VTEDGKGGATLRAFIESGGYEIKMMSDGHNSMVPMDERPALAELDALLAEVERLTRDLEKEQRATSEYVRAARFLQERANKAEAQVERLIGERDEMKQKAR
jgi:hypothetical protein